MRHSSDRIPWFIAGGAALALGLGGAYVASIVASASDSHDDLASFSANPVSPQPPASTTSAHAVEVYSNVIQSGGEIQGGVDAGGVDPAPGCHPTTTARHWFLSDPYPQGTVVDNAGSSEITAAQSASDDADGYLFDASIFPGESLSFSYEFDACRPFTIQLFFDARDTILAMQGPDGIAFDTETETPPSGAEIDVNGGVTLVTYTPFTAGTWTIRIEATGAREGSFWVEVGQQGARDTTPIAVCEVRVDGDTATLDASQSYDPDGDPVTPYWLAFEQDSPRKDGSTVDLSSLQHGWWMAYCVVDEEFGEFAKVGVEVWVGGDRPDIAPPATPVTFDTDQPGRAGDIACSVTAGPDGLAYQMPDHTVGGESFTAWRWDLPFGQQSTERSGRIEIPDGVGIWHYALCYGTTAEGTTHSSSILIRFE